MTKVKWKEHNTSWVGRHINDEQIYIFIYKGAYAPDINCPTGYLYNREDIERLIGIKPETPIEDCKLLFEAFVALNGW